LLSILYGIKLFQDLLSLNRERNSRVILEKQIDNYDSDKTIKFINFQGNVDEFNLEINTTDLFYGCLNHVCNNDRGLQFNPFYQSISFFDRYYMSIDNYSLIKSKYKFAEISTLPFTNHICMIKPTPSDRKIKKLIIK